MSLQTEKEKKLHVSGMNSNFKDVLIVSGKITSWKSESFSVM